MHLIDYFYILFLNVAVGFFIVYVSFHLSHIVTAPPSIAAPVAAQHGIDSGRPMAYSLRYSQPAFGI